MGNYCSLSHTLWSIAQYNIRAEGVECIAIRRMFLLAPSCSSSRASSPSFIHTRPKMHGTHCYYSVKSYVIHTTGELAKELACDRMRDEVLLCWPTLWVRLRGGTAGLELPNACKDVLWTLTGATGSILIAKHLHRNQ